MAEQWTVTGQVRRASDGAPVGDVVVEAWDRDVRFHSLLGQKDVGPTGRFTVAFDERHFGDYGGDHRPEVFFKVLRNGLLLHTTEHAPRTNLAPGQHAVALDVPDTNLQNGSTNHSPIPPPAPTGNEVVIHELGAALAATLATVQRELQRYPGAAGTQVVDEFDVTLPVTVRTDDLGQVMATVSSAAAPNVAMGSIRVRTRPQQGPVVQPVLAPQPLDVLPQLKPEDVEELRQRRVFTVDDLQRVSSTRPGLEALRKVVSGERLEQAIEQSEILSFGPLPSRVAEEMVRADVTGPTELVERDPASLARTLSRRLGEEVATTDVTAWQGRLRDLMRLDLPSRAPTGPVEAPSLELAVEQPR